jgi:FYVE zinc finger/PH domain
MVKKYWQPDEESSNCIECDEEFTMLNRRHHCRTCGLLFCDRCCPMREDKNGNPTKRICHTCFSKTKSTTSVSKLAPHLSSNQLTSKKEPLLNRSTLESSSTSLTFNIDKQNDDSEFTGLRDSSNSISESIATDIESVSINASSDTRKQRESGLMNDHEVNIRSPLRPSASNANVIRRLITELASAKAQLAVSSNNLMAFQIQNQVLRDVLTLDNHVSNSSGVKEEADSGELHKRVDSLVQSPPPPPPSPLHLSSHTCSSLVTATFDVSGFTGISLMVSLALDPSKISSASSVALFRALQLQETTSFPPFEGVHRITVMKQLSSIKSAPSKTQPSLLSESSFISSDSPLDDSTIIGPFSLAIHSVESNLNNSKSSLPTSAALFNQTALHRCCGLIRPGLLLVSINGVSLAGVSPGAVVNILQKTKAPLTLQFLSHPLAAAKIEVAKLSSSITSLYDEKLRMQKGMSFALEKTSHYHTTLLKKVKALTDALEQESVQKSELDRQYLLLKSEFEKKITTDSEKSYNIATIESSGTSTTVHLPTYMAALADLQQQQQTASYLSSYDSTSNVSLDGSKVSSSVMNDLKVEALSALSDVSRAVEQAHFAEKSLLALDPAYAEKMKLGDDADLYFMNKMKESDFLFPSNNSVDNEGKDSVEAATRALEEKTRRKEIEIAFSLKSSAEKAANSGLLSYLNRLAETSTTIRQEVESALGSELLKTPLRNPSGISSSQASGFSGNNTISKLLNGPEKSEISFSSFSVDMQAYSKLKTLMMLDASIKLSALAIDRAEKAEQRVSDLEHLLQESNNSLASSLQQIELLSSNNGPSSETTSTDQLAESSSLFASLQSKVQSLTALLIESRKELHRIRTLKSVPTHAGSSHSHGHARHPSRGGVSTSASAKGVRPSGSDKNIHQDTKQKTQSTFGKLKSITKRFVRSRLGSVEEGEEVHSSEGLTSEIHLQSDPVLQAPGPTNASSSEEGDPMASLLDKISRGDLMATSREEESEFRASDLHFQPSSARSSISFEHPPQAPPVFEDEFDEPREANVDTFEDEALPPLPSIDGEEEGNSSTSSISAMFAVHRNEPTGSAFDGTPLFKIGSSPPPSVALVEVNQESISSALPEQPSSSFTFDTTTIDSTSDSLVPPPTPALSQLSSSQLALRALDVHLDPNLPPVLSTDLYKCSRDPGKKRFSGWTFRWAKVQTGRCSYYKSQYDNMEKPQGSFLLRDITNVKVLPMKEAFNRANSIQIDLVNTKSYIFSLLDTSSRDSWLELLQHIVRSNQQAGV